MNPSGSKETAAASAAAKQAPKEGASRTEEEQRALRSAKASIEAKTIETKKQRSGKRRMWSQARVKGGPNPLPPVGDLIFEEEYGHAACSSVRSHGDWNVLVEKYDAALKRAREQVVVREKEEAVAREKDLRREFNETRSSDLAELEACKDSMKNLEFAVDKLGMEKADLEKTRAAESAKHLEEMNQLRNLANLRLLTKGCA
ncbi:hypothetical protein Bca52824_026940 [Brassica carinata]|uniref:Uncharacterized protein n=1 Tax=Brassica carinata TaxID=52824 RepID=A0A8X7SJ03_BRACI|nr:hypothetical protein Bca52824_026940 [Brassica carinata]